MFSSYRALLARAGARPLALACACGWLAFAGYSLAVILAVHAVSGSFPEAGGAVAAFAIGSGAGAPTRGRLIDRHGPGWLALFAGGHALASAVFVLCCVLRCDAWLLLSSAGACGVLAPPLIATARRVWRDVAGELTSTAHALNGALGDVGTLAGPAITGGLAAAVSPAFAFGALAGCASAAAALVSIRWRRRVPSLPEQPTAGRRNRLLRNSPGLLTLLLADVGNGATLGAVEVAVTALCARTHAADWAAVPLSASAVGGVLVSLWAGTGKLTKPAWWRYIAGSWFAALTLMPLVGVSSIVVTTCILCAAGAGTGLLAVALYELLDHVVPESRSVEAFTWLTTGQAVGIAAGAALAGQLTKTGVAAAFGLASTTALGAAFVASSRRATLTRPPR